MTPGHAAFSADWLLGVILLLAAVVTLPIAGIAARVYLQRRSTSYLLVALALFALVARIGIAAGTVLGVVPDALHHLVEHGLDVMIAALVVGATVAARRIEPRHAGDGE
jgi:nucleoside permease NupC